MCSQAVCLMAAELERRGISTVTLVLLREVAEKVRPPRALSVPFRHGYPLDTPADPVRQHAVLEAALSMLEDRMLRPPALRDFQGMPGVTLRTVHDGRRLCSRAD